MQNNSFLFTTLLSFAFFGLNAQDDLLAELEQETKPKTEYTFATFKGTKVVNLQTNELPSKGVLQYTFLHRFGSFTDDFFYNFLGLDNAEIMLTVDYSPADWLNLGVGYTGFEKTYNGFAKYKLLRQSKGAVNMPVSVTGFSSMYYSALRYNDIIERQQTDRLTYVHELVIARKFTRDLSLQVVPTLVHFNIVDRANQNNTMAALGFAGRYKFTNMHAITCEYVYQLNPNRDINGNTFQNALSIGVDIETGGHVFQLFLTNAQGVAEPYVFTQNTGDFFAGDIHFGFNVSRVFTVQKPKEHR